MRIRRGEVALVLGATSVALAVIASKQALADGVAVDQLLRARLLLAAAVVAPVLGWMLRRRRAGPGAIAVGLVTGALLWVGGTTELEGLERLPAGTLVLLLATTPLWVAALGWAGLGRRVPTVAELVAIGAVVAGLAVMAAPVGHAIDPAGAAFGLTTALTFATLLIVLDHNRGVDAPSGFLLALVGAALTALATDPGAVGEIGSAGLGVPLALALGLTTAAWAVLVGHGLEATDPVTTAIVVSIEPVLVSVLAFILLDEGLAPRELAGGAIVLAAVAGLALSAPARRPGAPSGPRTPRRRAARARRRPPDRPRSRAR